MSAHNNESWSTAPIVPVLTEKTSDCDLESLRQEISSLRRRQQDDFAAFRAELAAEIAAIESASAAALYDHTPTTTIEQPDSSMHPTSRRTLLKWGGVGAAAALAAAGGAALTTPTAHAANGANLLLGKANTAELITTLTHDGSEPAPTAFKVSIGDNGIAINGKAGDFNGGGSAGVLGSALDGATAAGLAGIAGANGIGTYGTANGSTDSWAVWGDTDAGIGVEGVSGTGIDLVANGTGRVYLFPTTSVGAPTSGSYSIGEQIRDAGGNLFICVASGAPGTWQKVAAAAAGRGGMVKFLSAPVRLLDTRPSHTPWVAGSVHALQVTGAVVGGISVPKGATGVIGNVTVVSPTAGGDLRLYPGGASAPGTSSLNFASGQIVANGVTVGLSASGQISIKVDLPAGHTTHVLFDASGYVM